jgi:hypothetical protein
MRDTLIKNFQKTIADKNRYILELNQFKAEKKFELNISRISNNQYLNNTNLNCNLNNFNLGYINEENINVINSTKVRFDNIQDKSEDKNKQKIRKKNSDKKDIKFDNDIVSTYIKIKTEQGKNL